MGIKSEKILGVVLCFLASGMILTGCAASEKKTDTGAGKDTSAMESEKNGSGDESVESDDKTESKESGDKAEEKDSETGFSFSDVSDREFWFASGAGAWSTVLSIHEDGTFEGEYHDSDMGDTGEGYPGGVMYLCEFSGKFTEPEKVDDYTYSMKIESIKTDQAPDTEEIKDGIRYIYSGPYGLEEAEEILIYLPGSPFQELPEAYRSWVGYGLSDTPDTKLPFYGLYNVAEELGFSSSEGSETAEIEEELAAVEKEAEALEEQLQSGNLTQIEMNETSAKIYKLWDDELNVIWNRLKESLDDAKMKSLTEEEREWIAYKEKEIKAAGSEYEGGSIQALEENSKGAELTKKRVYELAELLR